MPGITPTDMLKKLDFYVSRSQSKITYQELKSIYYLEKMRPMITSKSTFTEKIQDLIDFGFLEVVPIKTRNIVYLIKWEAIEIHFAKERGNE